MNSIARDRVHELLDRARARPLTVVRAPRGYGKTTALADWCRQLDGGCGWVTLQEQDNDPRRLCRHLLAAIDDLQPSATWAAEQESLGGSGLVETVADALAEHAEDGGLVVVLDDYDVIAEEACHRLMIALLDALPAGVHVVIAGRTRPPLRLARRRAAGTVAEIGGAELAFDAAEAERLLNKRLRLRLLPGQVEAIRARVEGWPAGLSLVASSLREGCDPDRIVEALAHPSGEIAEYLVEEVLDMVPPRIREFLRRTSVLDRMNGALCAAVLDDPTAGELFAEVQRCGLFVLPLDDGDGEDWVRYHQLFAALLQRELRRQDPSLVPLVHRRAADWFEREGLPEAAIGHATAAGDGARAARVLHQHWRRFVVERRYATIRRIVARLPPERGELGSFCEAVDVCCQSLEGADPRLVAERLDALERHRDAPGVAEIVDALRISPYYGDVGRALAAGRCAWDRAAGDAHARAHHAGPFATVMWFAGEREALQREVAPYMGVVEHPVLRSWELAALALSAADEGALDAAERHARDAVAVVDAAAGESALDAHLACVALAEALRRRGRLGEAHAQIGRALRATGRLPGSLYHALALVVRAQLDLSSRDRRAARAHATAARRIVDRYPDVGVLARRLASVEAALELTPRDALLDSAPTAAERRVLELLPTELTRRQIAAQLDLSVATVKSHAWRLYRRLGTTSRTEAVAIARERGLL
ncbi:MAG TPA: LuxR C-terminal-related transcriptional regulator [Conexibacter sp.]|nr:LuxR C-terminal-related transcriptional regulator [Conexibacter sp.]